eukprot:TRINITY_DN3155_c0_g3_i1.p1 TRINITY_DN3155_c0_g3~~TRINITY_DN3155_c0_g3_i1.p1  ORF type:complete len:179 (+),score=26.35 TRINITY_DN3155_c0_g3_i1:59-538(+)
MIASRTQRTALAKQRRGFLHLFFLKQKAITPGMANPWMPVPEWQKYLRDKAMQDPKYHQHFFDEINPEANRKGRKAEVFFLTIVVVVLNLYLWVLSIRTRSLQIECLKIEETQSKFVSKLIISDEGLLKEIVAAVDRVGAEKNIKKRKAVYEQEFQGLL